MRFLGCLPIYDYDASLLKSKAKKRTRALQMFHDCINIISMDMRKFCMKQHLMRAANGRRYVVAPRLAFIVADYQQIQQNLAHVGKACYMCECPYSSLDVTDSRWPLRNMQNIVDSMHMLADKVLDENGQVRYGMKKNIAEWEKKKRVRFMQNGFLPLIGTGFDLCLGSPRDLLHHILLGLFGEHIIASIIYLLIFDKSGLANPDFWKSNTRVPAPMNDKKANAIWDRLSQRLSNISEDDAGFTISSKMSKHFLKVNFKFVKSLK